jgi:hypothetical protein
MTRSRKLALVPTAVLAAGLLGVPAHGASSFTTKIDNPWFPLKPGTTLVYDGVKDGKAQRDVFIVTHRTRIVGGAPCVVISDRVFQGGHVVERTSDYYTQDRKGNVWYFGEDTAELGASGKVTTREGTWHAGVKGAKPGMFMPAHPRVGEHHRQEFFKGHSEDQFRVASLHASITVPYGTFRNALRTKEWTRLEPGVVDSKYYVRGIGNVFEGSVKGPRETARLVSVTHR